MEIKTPFFRLTIALLLKKVSLTFSTAVFKLAFSTTMNLWQKRKVSMKDSPVPAEARYSRLAQSNPKPRPSLAEIKRKTKKTRQVDLALHRNKSTCGEKKQK